MNKELRFQLPLPLDVEPMLESMLSAAALAQPFRARSYAAGDFVAELIRAAHATRVVSRVGRVAKAVVDKHHTKPIERMLAKATKPPEPPDEEEKPRARRPQPQVAPRRKSVR